MMTNLLKLQDKLLRAIDSSIIMRSSVRVSEVWEMFFQWSECWVLSVESEFHCFSWVSYLHASCKFIHSTILYTSCLFYLDISTSIVIWERGKIMYFCLFSVSLHALPSQWSDIRWVAFFNQWAWTWCFSLRHESVMMKLFKSFNDSFDALPLW